VPAETFTDGTFPDYGSSITDLGGGGFDFGDVSDPTEDNPEDVLDNQADPPPGPYDNWPPEYPTPNDPDWPFDTSETENTGPGGGNWITPTSPPDGWPFENQANTEWHVIYGSVNWIGYDDDCITAVNGGTIPASVGPTILSYGPPRGFFEEKTGASCSGHGSITYWIVVYPGDSSGTPNLQSLGGGGGGGNRVNLNDRIYSVSVVPVTP